MPSPRRAQPKKPPRTRRILNQVCFFFFFEKKISIGERREVSVEKETATTTLVINVKNLVSLLSPISPPPPFPRFARDLEESVFGDAEEYYEESGGRGT